MLRVLPQCFPSSVALTEGLDTIGIIIMYICSKVLSNVGTPRGGAQAAGSGARAPEDPGFGKAAGGGGRGAGWGGVARARGCATAHVKEGGPPSAPALQAGCDYLFSFRNQNRAGLPLLQVAVSRPKLPPPPGAQAWAPGGGGAGAVRCEGSARRARPPFPYAYSSILLDPLQDIVVLTSVPVSGTVAVVVAGASVAAEVQTPTPGAPDAADSPARPTPPPPPPPPPYPTLTWLRKGAPSRVALRRRAPRRRRRP